VAAPETSPLVIGPVEAIPPPPPKLPGQGHDDRGRQEGDTRKKGQQRDKGSGSTEAALLTGSCAPFTHTQTYLDWGPAVAYGGPVTVMYQADRCSTPNGSALDLAAEGTAQVFQGETSAGALLDTRPFLVTGTWREPQNAEAWPPAWWGCEVPYASYAWEIPGVYSFLVSARDGVWTLDITSQGVGSQTVSWTHDGCA
jgi:hypothetical protein